MRKNGPKAKDGCDTLASNSCLALFRTSSECRNSMRKLADAGFPDTSIAALELISAPEQFVSLPYFSPLSQTPIQVVPCAGNSALLVRGFPVPSVQEADDERTGTGWQRISELLADMGLSAAGQSRYSSALAQGQALIIVRGTVDQVDSAAELLATGNEIEVAVYLGEYFSGQERQVVPAIAQRCPLQDTG